MIIFLVYEFKIFYYIIFLFVDVVVDDYMKRIIVELVIVMDDES